MSDTAWCVIGFMFAGFMGWITYYFGFNSGYEAGKSIMVGYFTDGQRILLDDGEILFIKYDKTDGDSQSEIQK